MDRTRLNLLALVNNLMFIEEPPAPGGGDETPPEGASTPENPGEEADEEDGEDGNDFASLPSWAQSEIKKLRKGEGKYRTTANDLQEKLKAAKSQDDIEAAVKTYRERNVELEVELATARHTVGFTPEQLALVDGKTPEEIEEKAKKVRAAFANQEQAPDPLSPHADGGSRPGSNSGGAGLTPQELARQTRERIGRRR